MKKRNLIFSILLLALASLSFSDLDFPYKRPLFYLFLFYFILFDWVLPWVRRKK